MQQYLTWLCKSYSSIPRLNKSIPKNNNRVRKKKSVFRKKKKNHVICEFSSVTNCYSRSLQVVWFSEARTVSPASLPSCRSGRLYLHPCATRLLRKWGLRNNSAVAVHMANQFSKYTQEINTVMPPSPRTGKLSVPTKPGFRITVIIFFDRQNKWKPRYQYILCISNKALLQSKVLFIKTLLITFWLAHWVKKSTLEVSSGATSHLKSQDIYFMLLMVSLSKGNLNFSPLVPFPQVELPPSDSKIHP